MATGFTLEELTRHRFRPGLLLRALEEHTALKENERKEDGFASYEAKAEFHWVFWLKARALIELGRYEDAEQALLYLLDVFKDDQELCPVQNIPFGTREELVIQQILGADVYMPSGRYAEAKTAFERYIALLTPEILERMPERIRKAHERGVSETYPRMISECEEQLRKVSTEEQDGDAPAERD